MKHIAKYAKKYWIYTVLAPLMIIGEVILEVNIPKLMSVIVDEGIGTSGNVNTDIVFSTGLKMVGMAMAALIFGVLSARFAAKAGMGLGSEMRKGLFNKVQDFSFSNVDKFSTAALVTRLTTDVTSVQNMFMQLIRGFVRSPLMLTMAIILARGISSELTSVFLFVTPLVLVVVVILAYITLPKFREMFKKYDKFNATIQENLISIRVVKTFVRTEHEKDKFRASNDDLMNFSIRAEKIIAVAMPLMMMTMYGCILAVLWLGGRQIAYGTMTTGELISFISYISQILMSLMMVCMMLVSFVMSRASIQRISEVLDEETDIVGAENSQIVVETPSVEFKNVSFKYNKDAAENVLENINLTINAGETVGIIGGTGSSKTTLVQLIARLYDVTCGEVLVGGVNVKDYSLENLRESVAMVLQKNVLFTGTIEENLKWGNENATHEQIVEACKMAQAHDFIESFPGGYNTDLGQGGVNVSGGQKQRLCIARALLKNPKILILDDSTSAVDTATDSKIRQAMGERLEDMTTIIIAQRISSIENADKIIVLDNGTINAVGTHEVLLSNNEIYSEVYTSQQKGGER